MFYSKKDRQTLSMIDGAVYEATGYDRHSYESDARDRNSSVARAFWVYEVYNRTMLGQYAIADIIKLNQSNVGRAIKNVKKWIGSPKKYPREYQVYKSIKDEIQSRVMETGVKG